MGNLQELQAQTDMRDKVRPLYGDFIGLMSAAPDPKEGALFYSAHTWEIYHSKVDKLQEITGESFEEYKVTPKGQEDVSDSYVYINEYRSKLSALWNTLYYRFYSEENPPFSGTPATVVHQSQSQSQSMIVDVRQFIISKEAKYTKGSDERKLLEKVKGSLDNVKNGVELVKLFISTAKSLGLSLDTIQTILI
jgi:hypothetical protein